MNYNFDGLSDYDIGYEYFNPNPRGCLVGDCVKRAIVVATDIDYKELELFMNRNKVIKGKPYNDRKNFTHVIDLLGGKTINMNVPQGTYRWHISTISDVMRNYDKVTYILQVSHHVIGVRKNVIYDTFDDRPRDKGIYKMWIFNATENEVKEIQDKVSKGGYKVL